MKIPDDVLNSHIEYCINEYVRLYEHREMLRERWFYGQTLEKIAEKHCLSVTQVKNIIYTQGDKILIRASQM